MSISVGATVEANPGANVEKLLQMIGTAGSDCSSVKVKNTNGVGNNDENVNNFFQILDQQIAALLQTGESEISEQLTTKEDLCMVLEKLLQDDQNAGGEILSEFALLAVAGKLSELYAGENDISDESEATTKIEDLLGKVATIEGLLTDIEEKVVAELNTNTEKSENTALRDKPVNSSVEQDEDLLAEVAIEKIETQNNSANTALQDKSVNSSVKQGEDLLAKVATVESLLTGIKEKVVVATNKNAEKIETQINAAITALQDKSVNSSVKQGEDLLAKVATVESLLTGIKEKMVAQLNTNSGNIETQTDSAKTLLQEMKAGTLNGYEDVQRKASAEVEEKASQLNGVVQNDQNKTGQDVKNKMLEKQEMLLAGKQENPSITDAQKNMTGKVAALPDEAAAMIEKTKSAIKGKTLTSEKNIESNSLSSSNISGVVTVKTETGEISSSSIINRVTAELRENLSNEGGRVKIILTPPSLGTLEMDVIVRNGAVKIMLMADNKDVQQLLSGNLDSLKGALQSQGLTIERCDVMMQDRREQYPQGFNQQAFNQEQSAKQHYDEGEGYKQENQTVTSLKIRPMNQSTQSLGNISLFA